MGIASSATQFEIQATVFDLDGLLVNTEELYQDVGTELLRPVSYTHLRAHET